MGPFLGRSAFPGPAIEADAAGHSFVGQARFSGCIAFTNWPRTDVAALLPPGLALASNTAAPDLHPLVFVFGEQADGALLFAGLTLPTGAQYHELAIVVPFVLHRGERHLHSYVPRMYSSYFPAIWHGNAQYGFGKEMARMCWQGDVFVATRDDGALLLHAAREPCGPWAAATPSAAVNFASMQAVFRLPVVGRRADGSWVRSYFGWDFARASVRPADCLVSVDAALFPGLCPRQCPDATAGTFEVRDMLWRLSWPQPTPG